MAASTPPSALCNAGRLAPVPLPSRGSRPGVLLLERNGCLLLPPAARGSPSPSAFDLFCEGGRCCRWCRYRESQRVSVSLRGEGLLKILLLLRLLCPAGLAAWFSASHARAPVARSSFAFSPTPAGGGGAGSPALSAPRLPLQIPSALFLKHR